MELVQESATAPDSSGQPPGTLSQIVQYSTVIDGQLVKLALVHRYLLPDGAIGASGLPDPKMAFHDGIIYLLERGAH